MKYILTAGLITFCPIAASAETIEGTWSLYEVLDYENLIAAPKKTQTPTIHINKETISISPTCKTKIHRKTYRTDLSFQLLLKSGEKEEDIEKFFLKHFGFRPDPTTEYYKTDHHDDCNRLGGDAMLANNKLIIIGGPIFNVFMKSTSEMPIAAIDAKSILPQNLKATPLPFKSADYMEHCAGNLSKRKGIPQPAAKCAPLFFPYLASRESKDSVSKTIGSHNYFSLGGRNGTSDYDNPVANGLHPLFIVFPPLGDIILARIDDLERTEDRDVTSTTYISIKNNKVVDQLNDGCDFNQNYLCNTPSHGRKYQLLRSGQFIELK